MKRLILIASMFCSGCLHPGFNHATAPKVGAAPRWVPSIPAGGHWQCAEHYEYNAESLRCELKGEGR